MSKSAVQICNVALSMIGELQIDNITLGSTNERERQCALLYPVLRDKLLRMHPWNFAEKRQRLAALTETPDFEFDYYYQLPSDCIRARRLYDSLEDFRVEADLKLATNASPCNLIYTSRVEDPAKFDDGFSYALSCMIAADASMTISNSRTLQEQLMMKAERQIKEAKQLDSQEGMARPVKTRNSWKSMRRYWKGGSSRSIY